MANLHVKRPWQWIRESNVTPERVYLNRREALAKLGVGVGALSALSAACNSTASLAQQRPASLHIPEFWSEKWADLFPARRNAEFKTERETTPERIFTSYNNFYEFSLDKDRVLNLVGRFETTPWQVRISGEVENGGVYDLDDLIRMGELEERIYHFRCVEAWSANVPWTGFPLHRLIEKVQPTADAKFVRFVTVYRPEQMPGQKNRDYPWPYYEGLTMDEAMNELALLTFGLYGHPLNKQNGAPVRIVVPWKYGFKSIKSVVEIEFVRKRPGTLWSDISREYGFYANTHPGFAHPRWSQATERFLNNQERIPTRIYNGYGDYVAHLYNERNRRYFF